jgi:hypothetical protein
VELSISSNFQPTPDIIFFGTQECQTSLCVSFCCEAKTDWEDMLVEVFSSYDLMVSETMRGLHSAVLIKKGLKEHF